MALKTCYYLLNYQFFFLPILAVATILSINEGLYLSAATYPVVNAVLWFATGPFFASWRNQRRESEVLSLLEDVDS
jgi:hypothetical protein